MADRIELELGHAPWRPSSDSELITTYRYYDGPLLGVVRQHGNDYIFSCLAGEDETLSLWFYAPITGEQQVRFAAMTSEEFNEAWPHTPLAGNTVLAFATERLGIVDSEAVEDSDDPEIAGERLRVAARALRERLHELSEDAAHLETAIA